MYTSTHLEDDDGGGLDLLVLVKGAVDVVVDGLHHGLALLELLDAAEHVVKVVLAGVESGEAWAAEQRQTRISFYVSIARGDENVLLLTLEGFYYCFHERRK
jgi:hypothetical protein